MMKSYSLVCAFENCEKLAQFYEHAAAVTIDIILCVTIKNERKCFPVIIINKKIAELVNNV